jgi:threonine-phosphate decarboxylase
MEIQGCTNHMVKDDRNTTMNRTQENRRHPGGHGGNVSEASRRYGVNEKEIIDFSANYNPLDTRKITRGIIKKYMGRLFSYPDALYHDLLAGLQSFYRIRRDNCVCGNGSIELIYLLARILNVKKAIITVPNFIDYELAFQKEGRKIQYLPGKESAGFKVPVDELSEAGEEGAVLVLSNPNNPAGYTYTKKEMETLAYRVIKKGCFLLVDEAFGEFAGKDEYGSLLHRAQEVPGLFVLRSLTKILTIPGIRLGFCTGNRKTIDSLKNRLYPWNLNAFATVIGEHLDAYRTIIEKTPGAVARERARLEEMLATFPSLQRYPSGCNYILLKRRDEKPVAGLVDYVARRGFLIRDCSNYTSLDGSFFRIAVKKHRENKKLIHLFRDYFEEEEKR